MNILYTVEIMKVLGMADNLDVLIQEADISYRWLTIKESADTTQEGGHG